MNYDLRKDPAVLRFAEAAAAYCALTTDLQATPGDLFPRSVALALSELYAAALNLPILRNASVGAVLGAYMDFEEFRGVENAVAAKLGAQNLYWEVYDPSEHSQPVSTTLSDDLADIHRDLSDGLAEYRRGSPAAVRMAVRHWQESFVIHWGDHLVDALRALHRVVAAQRDEQM